MSRKLLNTRIGSLATLQQKRADYSGRTKCETKDFTYNPAILGDLFKRAKEMGGQDLDRVFVSGRVYIITKDCRGEAILAELEPLEPYADE